MLHWLRDMDTIFRMSTRADTRFRF